jgi:hypothetical protein
MSTPSPDDLLSIEEAARVAAVARTAIVRAMKDGRLPYTVKALGPIMQTTRIRRADAEAFQYRYPAMEAARQERLRERGDRP